MSSALRSATSNPAAGSPGSGNLPPVDALSAGTGGRLYRIVWRWHFYAGMIVAPVLVVLAATGALYIFKDELEGVLHPGVVYVEPGAERVSYERQLAAARAAVPPNYRIGLIQIFTDPRRATSLAMAGDKSQFGYVDPYRGHYLGSIEQGGFFDVVLKLHRQLFLGTTGRVVVELTTCWTIVLVVTGVYLWWPRKAGQLWGVWLPRLRRKSYVVLRDLHALTGMYLGAVALVIALTGLIYTYLWGSGFQYVALKTDAYDIFSKPMLSKSAAELPDVPIDQIVETARRRMPDNNLTVWFPRAPNAVYLVTANNERGPQVNEILFIDRASGEVLEDRHSSQTKTMYWLGIWNYPLHVGTIWGLPSKCLWLAACLMLMAMPVTGIWMWWQRRPRGQLGLPRRVDARRPRWLVVTIVATSVLLPALGLSVLVLLVGERIVGRWLSVEHA